MIHGFYSKSRNDDRQMEDESPNPIAFIDSNKTWIEYPFLFYISDLRSVYSDDESLRRVSIGDEILQTTREISSNVSKICKRLEDVSAVDEGAVCFHFDPKNWSGFVILCCVVIRRFKFTVARAITYVRSSIYFGEGKKWNPHPRGLWLINNYKPPLKVLFCGDRNTATCFEDVITFELKALPEDSIVVHGGCEGVDLYVDELARLADIERMEFSVSPEMWETLGRAAGPVRNLCMLKEGGPIDYVLAFHPDIDMSKGTKDMMNQAWKAGIPVYIHDLKRKSKFEGDFSVL